MTGPWRIALFHQSYSMSVTPTRMCETGYAYKLDSAGISHDPPSKSSHPTSQPSPDPMSTSKSCITYTCRLFSSMIFLIICDAFRYRKTYPIEITPLCSSFNRLATSYASPTDSCHGAPVATGFSRKIGVVGKCWMSCSSRSRGDLRPPRKAGGVATKMALSVSPSRQDFRVLIAERRGGEGWHTHVGAAISPFLTFAANACTSGRITVFA